ncbi:uncharacterized protein TNCT_396401 [Trichonephila clavata]|uniref:Uncharacterized protein n=1 Tax=Trichonephila clavata TaxID=2740835 RepID=A0A8X6HKH3_TRICU|nr:uncharacterized protein TNCT_396401 [Trichonephila clavata]
MNFDLDSHLKEKEQRCWQIISVVVAVIFLCNILPCDCAPFRIKHYSSQKSVIHRGGRPSISGSSSIQLFKRGQRRLIQGSSPIHFINPFVPTIPPLQSFDSFFIPPISMGKSSLSSIYRLPLRLLNNGKPQKVLHVLPKKSPQFMEFLPHASSNIIHLPLKFVSNGKPVGIYIKEKSLNYL